MKETHTFPTGNSIGADDRHVISSLAFTFCRGVLLSYLFPRTGPAIQRIISGRLQNDICIIKIVGGKSTSFHVKSTTRIFDCWVQTAQSFESILNTKTAGFKRSASHGPARGFYRPSSVLRKVLLQFHG